MGVADIKFSLLSHSNVPTAAIFVLMGIDFPERGNVPCPLPDQSVVSAKAKKTIISPIGHELYILPKV